MPTLLAPGIKLLDSLDDAISASEQFRNAQFPNFSDLHVVKDWQGASRNDLGIPNLIFFTDNRKIYAAIQKPESVERLLEKTAFPIFRKSYGEAVAAAANGSGKQEFLRTLAFHGLWTLLNHENLHPVACPNSKEDEQRIDLALFKGISEAQPGLDKKDVLKKVWSVRNLVWDHGVDAFQHYFTTTDGPYKSNLEAVLAANERTIGGHTITRFPDGALSLWHVVSIAGAQKAAMDPAMQPRLPALKVYNLTRLLYGMLFCADEETRAKTCAYFLGSAKLISGFDKGATKKIVKKALEGLVGEIGDEQLATAGVDGKGFGQALGRMFTDLAEEQYGADQSLVVETMTRLLMDPATRYKAIEGFIKPFAPYISTIKKEKDNHSKPQESQGPGQGMPSDGQSAPSDAGEMGDVLDNIVKQMPKGEAGKLLKKLAKPSGAGKGEEGVNRLLELKAAHEFYMRNSKDVILRGPKPERQSVRVGNVKEWQLVSSTTLQESELYKLNVSALNNFAAATGLPVLVPLGRGMWKVNTFRVRELPLKSLVLQYSGVELPRNIVFLADASRSMSFKGPQDDLLFRISGGLAGQTNFVGSENRYDALMRRIYGILKPLDKVRGDQVVDLYAVSYSLETRAAGPVPLQDFFTKTANPVTVNLFSPQFQNTVLDAAGLLTVERRLKAGRTVYICFSDGDLQNFDEQVAGAFRQIATRKDVSMVFFQLYNSGGVFGDFIRGLSRAHPNATSHFEKDIGSITGQQVMELVVKYREVN